MRILVLGYGNGGVIRLVGGEKAPIPQGRRLLVVIVLFGWLLSITVAWFESIGVHDGEWSFWKNARLGIILLIMMGRFCRVGQVFVGNGSIIEWYQLRYTLIDRD